MLLAFSLTVFASLFNAVLSIYFTNSEQHHKYDNLLMYFAIILSCSAIITDIIYLAYCLKEA